ncbi:MAG: LysR family transcriptional regulator [Clostridia bacterium]|nr:LysR family transcriptional regulator [Clostridia bacterium]
MDMKQLTTFMTLAKTLNYQKAADQLQYAPSTLFKHIQLLEQELGVELFEKAGRQLRLTSEGEAFIAHAEDILDRYRHAVRSISGCEEKESSLSIGGCEINTANSLLNLFAQFSGKHPDARMSMHTGPNAGVPAMVKSELVDLGFYYSLTNAGIPGLYTQKMYQEPVCLIAEKQHPLAAKAQVCYEDLQGERFVYPHDSCCFVVELFARLKSRGVKLGRTTFPGSMYLVVEQIHTRNALTLMPHSAAKRFCEYHDMVELNMAEEPILAWEMLVYKDEESLGELARKLLAYGGEYAQRMLKEDPNLSN